MCVFNVCSLNNTSPQKAHSRFHIFAWSFGSILSLGAGVVGVVDGDSDGDGVDGVVDGDVVDGDGVGALLDPCLRSTNAP